ncbi:MAG TPA: hypothetical protein VN176_15905 [Verrucomicrobiae bacterium]|nr:hypothetical protein [Verrucomicrobiae bacterium]
MMGAGAQPLNHGHRGRAESSPGSLINAIGEQETVGRGLLPFVPAEQRHSQVAIRRGLLHRRDISQIGLWWVHILFGMVHAESTVRSHPGASAAITKYFVGNTGWETLFRAVSEPIAMDGTVDSSS